MQERARGHAVARLSESQIVKFKPEKAGVRDAEADAVILVAKRVKDWPSLEMAVDQKIKDQKEFLGWWHEKVTPLHRPGRRGNKELVSERKLIPVDQAQKLTGITKLKVHRWDTRFKDEAAYRDRLFGAAYRTAMAENINDTIRGAAATGETERYTPARFVEAVRKVLGEIDLDPASCKEAQETVKAKKFFTEREDGLKHDWYGNVFLNAPYTPKLLPAFIRKLIAEIKAGRVSAAILLTNNCTDTAWFRTALSAAQAICFTHGRIQFITPRKGKTVGTPLYAQCFFYYGDDVEGFAKVFRQIGWGGEEDRLR
jgi:hypothetical protein